MVIRELISQVAKRLEDAGCDNCLFEANQIIRHITGFSQVDLVLNHQADASDYMDKAFALAKERENHKPLQYILGTQEFMSLEFFTSENVLIPRSDTETLVEYVLENTQGEISLLDIGTGTGCIPLSVAHYNKKALVRGLDISPSALELAKKNAEKLKLTKRAVFEKLDILKEAPSGRYDVVTSNPPYIESDVVPTLQAEVRDYEPHLALDGGQDGLDFYRRITAIAPRFIKPSGLLIFEIGYNQAEAVSALMEKDFEKIRTIKDLCKNDRVVCGYLKRHHI
jgi:release factor glutamine methyltransferase